MNGAIEVATVVGWECEGRGCHGAIQRLALAGSREVFQCENWDGDPFKHFTTEESLARSKSDAARIARLGKQLAKDFNAQLSEA